MSTNGPTHPAGNEMADLVDAVVSRRGLLVGGAAAAAMVAFFGGPRDLLRAGGPAGAASPLFSFTPVGLSTADSVVVPPEYGHDVVYRWGDPVKPGGPAFLFDATNTASDQQVQAGMGHDGIEFFPLPSGGGAAGPRRGLLVMNHEFAENFLLFSDGDATWTKAKVFKSQFAHGVSVIAIEFDGTTWNQITSKYNRRVTARSRLAISGPAAGHPKLQTAWDPTGTEVLGTVNNCGAGHTPWGTYLTCEENFNAYFGSTVSGAAATPLMARYGVGTDGFGPDWWKFDNRFDIAKVPNESNRFGWVVEIDPRRPSAKPVKRTALGRMKHENAYATEAADGRVVVYTGDDERGEYVYKYVSRLPWQDMVNAGVSPLDDGTLYVARFDDDATAGDGAGVGTWLPLVHGSGPLTAGNGFADQGDVLINARGASDLLGATHMDRPEWITRDPLTGDVYATMTNNSKRGTSWATDEANPRGPNPYGHIIRWSEAGGDAAAMTFTWDLFVLAGDPANPAHGATPGIDAFGSPDGLAFDPDGRLWIQTDGSQPVACNNQLLMADPATGDVKRFLVGPKGCEITGITWSADRKTAFINVQHPGENGTAADPRAESNWPDYNPVGRPRDSTIAVYRLDGGIVGT